MGPLGRAGHASKSLCIVVGKDGRILLVAVLCGPLGSLNIESKLLFDAFELCKLLVAYLGILERAFFASLACWASLWHINPKSFGAEKVHLHPTSLSVGNNTRKLSHIRISNTSRTPEDLARAKNAL